MTLKSKNQQSGQLVRYVKDGKPKLLHKEQFFTQNMLCFKLPFHKTIVPVSKIIISLY